MSTARQAKIAGIPLGAEPKKLGLLVGMVVLAIIVYFMNSRSDTPQSTTSVPNAVPSSASVNSAEALTNTNRSTMAQARSARRRIANNKVNDRGVLKLRPVNGSQGNIDPTLRLDLLSRLQSIEVSAGQRNLFGMGPASVPATIATKYVPPKVGRIVPGPLPGSSSPSTGPVPTPVAQIPLKFYGFIQSRAPRSGNRGFFLNGDDVLVGSEGDVLLNQFRIVQLGQGGAVMEDATSKNRQTIPLVPEVRGDS